MVMLNACVSIIVASVYAEELPACTADTSCTQCGPIVEDTHFQSRKPARILEVKNTSWECNNRCLGKNASNIEHKDFCSTSCYCVSTDPSKAEKECNSQCSSCDVMTDVPLLEFGKENCNQCMSGDVPDVLCMYCFCTGTTATTQLVGSEKDSPDLDSGVCSPQCKSNKCSFMPGGSKVFWGPPEDCVYICIDADNRDKNLDFCRKNCQCDEEGYASRERLLPAQEGSNGKAPLRLLRTRTEPRGPFSL